MSGKNIKFSRRDFIKMAGAAGSVASLVQFGSLRQACGSSSTIAADQMVVPTRPFGKTGANVSILALGGVLQ
ncbi:MAG: twin-arginine translocation signal domain-containing protein [Desulfobacterales bacterium]